MKGGLVVSLYAVKALSALSLVTPPIKFVFVTDEETLHMHSNAKAVLRREITGAKAFLNFEPCAENGQVVLSRYGGGPVSIHVHGCAAHSGTSPEKDVPLSWKPLIRSFIWKAKMISPEEN